MGSARRALIGLVLMSLLVAACSGGGGRKDGNVAAKSSSTDATPAPPTSTASTAATVKAGTCPPTPPRVAPRPDRSKYTLTVDVKPDEGIVTGTVAVRFTPDLVTDKLVFRLWPNGPRPRSGGSKLVAGDVKVDGAPAQVTGANATTMEVRRGSGFAARKPVNVSMTYQLTLPGSVSDRISRTGEAIRLGSFFPILGWEPGRGWAIEPPTAGFAEASTAATADFEATITVPDGLNVLATGVPDGKGKWSAPLVADFAVSIGRFKLVEGTTNAPNPVKVTVGVHETLNENPKAYLDKSLKVLADFGQRFGPYPWPVYTLAITPNLGGGIEYPNHVMQGPGTLGRTTSHEIGHMWFYGLIEDNQGRDPWIDEGLATWAEYRYESSAATLLKRQIPAPAKGQAGKPMAFWEDKQRVYYDGVYLQGAQAFAALGAPDLVDCALRRFVALNAYRVATPATVLDAMDDVFPDAPAVFARYGIKP